MIRDLIKEILREELTGVKEIKCDAPVNAEISRKVMIRTYSAGVHFGDIVSRVDKEVKLENAHRVFYWKGACSLSQLAMEGSNERSDCKISVKVDSITLTEAIEIIDMTDFAYDNLAGGDLWKK